MGDERLIGRLMVLAAPCGPAWGATALNRGRSPLDPRGSPLDPLLAPLDRA